MDSVGGKRLLSSFFLYMKYRLSRDTIFFIHYLTFLKSGFFLGTRQVSFFYL